MIKFHPCHKKFDFCVLGEIHVVCMFSVKEVCNFLPIWIGDAFDGLPKTRFLGYKED